MAKDKAARAVDDGEKKIIGTQWWVCKPCNYRIQTHDAHGKLYKKVPRTCPSCGAPTAAPGPAAPETKP